MQTGCFFGSFLSKKQTKQKLNKQHQFCKNFYNKRLCNGYVRDRSADPWNIKSMGTGIGVPPVKNTFYNIKYKYEQEFTSPEEGRECLVFLIPHYQVVENENHSQSYFENTTPAQPGGGWKKSIGEMIWQRSDSHHSAKRTKRSNLIGPSTPCHPEIHLRNERWRGKSKRHGEQGKSSLIQGSQNLSGCSGLCAHNTTPPK